MTRARERSPLAAGAGRGRRPLDAAGRRGAPRRAAALQRPPGGRRPGSRRTSSASACGAWSRRAWWSPSPTRSARRASSYELTGDRPRAGRRAAAAGRLGRAPPRRRRAASPRRVRDAARGALVLPDLRAHAWTRATRKARASTSPEPARLPKVRRAACLEWWPRPSERPVSGEVAERLKAAAC